MAVYHLSTDDLRASIPLLRAGDEIYLNGIVYTARDAAHKKMAELIKLGRTDELPFVLQEAVIYYAGPTPAPGKPIGACGPTTSQRMDAFAPGLYNLGVAATIGKGERAQTVKDSLIQNGAAYFAAVGGAGALYARCVRSCREIGFAHLGCESVKRLEINDFYAIVAYDLSGGDVYAKKHE